MAQIGYRSLAGVGDWTDCIIDKSYTVDYTLNMVRNVDVIGFVSWVDMKLDNDTIRSKFKIEIENDSVGLQIFENNLKGHTEETITPVLRNVGGFYPLTPLYKSCMKSGEAIIDNYYELSIKNIPQPEQIDIYGQSVHYEVETIANGADLIPSDIIPSCGKYSGWILDGMSLPFPVDMPKPKLNSVDKSSQLNGNSYNPKRYKREFGEVVNITIKLDEEHTRLFLQKINTIRDSLFDIITPANYNFFAHLYPSNSSFKCILNSNKISVEVVNYKYMSVSFSLQLQAVNS